MKKHLTLSLLLFGFVVTLPSAFAEGTLLTANSTSIAVASDITTTGLTPLDSISGSFLSATLNGTYTETVNLDPNATLACPSGGCLDFILQVTDVSSVHPPDNPLARVTEDDFTGFTLDAGAVKGSSGIAAESVALDSTGATVSWNFAGLTTGQESVELDVQTNATLYTESTLGFQDGSGATAPGFMPLATPEPGTYALIGLGLAGLGLIRRRSIRAN